MLTVASWLLFGVQTGVWTAKTELKRQWVRSLIQVHEALEPLSIHRAIVAKTRGRNQCSEQRLLSPSKSNYLISQLLPKLCESTVVLKEY